MTPETVAIISAAGGVLSGAATAAGILVAYMVHKNQKLLNQRQLLLPLWEHISTLNDIDPQDPITPDVIKTVNTLELVALCCEGEMIDKKIIRRTFKDEFMKHYENIGNCTSLPGTSHTGKTLLKQNRATTEFYESLERERLSQDRLS